MYDDTLKACSDSLTYLSKPEKRPTKNRYPDFMIDTIEQICCNRHFGGMPIEDVIALVRKHAPEYFV